MTGGTLSARIAAREVWHYCDGRGATTTARAATRAELVAKVAALFDGPAPSWMGAPCDRPLDGRKQYHEGPRRFTARDMTGALRA